MDAFLRRVSIVSESDELYLEPGQRRGRILVN